MIYRFAVALICLLALPPVLSQTGDDQTDDHERQDRRYFERYTQRGEEDAGDQTAQAEAYVARADELIRDRHYRSDSSATSRVQTDDPRVRAKSVVALVDDFRAFFEEFWQNRVELRPYDKRTRFFVFYSFHKYNQLLESNFRFRQTRPKGHYGSVNDAVVVHSDAGPAATLADTLIHEAAHQLISQRLYPDGQRPHPWVAEGLASYFGYTFLDKGGDYRPGVIGGKSVDLYKRKGGKGPGNEAKRRLRMFRTEFKGLGPEDEQIFDWIVSIDDSSLFYGSDVRVTYPASWVLVHFLLHADEGAHAAAFFSYLEADGEGDGTTAVLYEGLGMTPEELESRVRGYLKGLKSK